MKLSELITIVLTQCLLGSSSVIVGDCDGGEAVDLPDGCEVVNLLALSITGEVDVPKVKKKLSTVKQILAGLEVVDTDLEVFDFLKNVESISSSAGPALFFKGNSELTRIEMPKLSKLDGKEYAVIFDDDHFPAAAYESPDAYTDLRRLQAIALKNTGDCSAAFMHIASMEKSESGILIWILVGLCVVAATGLAVQTFFFIKNKKARKKASEETSKEAKNEGDGKKKEVKEGAEPKKKGKEKLKEK